MKKILVLVLCIIVMISSFGCSSNSRQAADGELKTPPKIDEEKIEEAEHEEEVSNQQAIDPFLYKINESGKVMILMYHVIGNKEGDWARTVDNFRKDLQVLYDKGYSLISLNDFVNNNITTPLGRTPIVLTFDDGTEGHFRFITNPDGTKTIDPNCAVGIIKEFAEEHPDFGTAATFYINSKPFGQREYWQDKLHIIQELGMEIGNHTLTHPKLNRLKDEDVQKELAGLVKQVQQVIPGYRVNSLALPFGIKPQNYNLALSGEYNNTKYEHMAVLAVGAQPAKAPATLGHNPHYLPRVKASQEEIEKWLVYFDTNPQEKYISDGRAQVVMIPKEKEAIINKASLINKEFLVY